MEIFRDKLYLNHYICTYEHVTEALQYTHEAVSYEPLADSNSRRTKQKLYSWHEL